MQQICIKDLMVTIVHWLKEGLMAGGMETQIAHELAAQSNQNRAVALASQDTVSTIELRQ